MTMRSKDYTSVDISDAARVGQALGHAAGLEEAATICEMWGKPGSKARREGVALARAIREYVR